MADEEKKIIVDDDWKAEAKREKERLEQETVAPEGLPAPSFGEVVNMIVMQALVGFGMIEGPGGQRIPPNLEVAKHYIDLLDIVEKKTKGNLEEEEQAMLDQITYDLRMRYVQIASGGTMPPAAP